MAWGYVTLCHPFSFMLNFARFRHLSKISFDCDLILGINEEMIHCIVLMYSIQFVLSTIQSDINESVSRIEHRAHVISLSCTSESIMW